MTACIRFTVLILRIRGSNIVVRFEKRPAWLAGAGSVRTPGERKKSAGALAKKRYARSNNFTHARLASHLVSISAVPVTGVIRFLCRPFRLSIKPKSFQRSSQWCNEQKPFLMSEQNQHHHQVD